MCSNRLASIFQYKLYNATQERADSLNIDLVMPGHDGSDKKQIYFFAISHFLLGQATDLSGYKKINS